MFVIVGGNQHVSLYFSLQTKNSKEVLWNGMEGLSEREEPVPSGLPLLILIMS